jgi:hypothetical protein
MNFMSLKTKQSGVLSKVVVENERWFSRKI